MPIKSSIHIFERAGLGIAPFKFIGCETRVYKASPDSPAQCGYSCDYCGTPIMQCCHIKDANGATFIVGNECVYKTQDKNLVDETKAAILKLQREKRHEAEAARINAAKTLLAGSVELQTVLSFQPHPNKWQADNGKTLLDFVNWMFDNAGNKGKLEAAKVVKSNEGVPVSDELKNAFFANQRAIEAAKEAEAEAERQKQIAKETARQMLIAENADILAVLRSKNHSDFIAQMIWNLENAPLRDLSSRQFAIVSDIFAKSQARANSGKYHQIIEELKRRCYA